MEPDERAECAIQIAGVIVSWTQIETQLATLLAVASGYIPKDDDSDQSVKKRTYLRTYENEVARAALSAIDSLHARIAVVKAVWEVIRLPENLALEFETIGRMLRKAAGWRNLVAHSDWRVSDDYPCDLIEPEERKRYTADDFVLMRLRIHEVGYRIGIFQRKCVKLLESRPGHPHHYWPR